LANSEIIGFLGGTWSADSKVLSITEAFPCKSVATEEDHVNVEMDPQSELEVREVIKKNGLRVVGWYHSHPVFQPDPSIRDIENQTSYQTLFRDENHNSEPFVGIIVGPYDRRMPTEESAINFFYIKKQAEKIGQPMAVEYTIKDIDATSTILEEKLQKLIDSYKSYPTRMDWEELWRYCAPLNPTDLDEGKKKINVEPTTKFTKLQKAIRFQLSKVPSEQAEAFIKKIMEELEKNWEKLR